MRLSKGTFLSLIAAFGLLGFAGTSFAKEKCYGIAVAEQNDCSTNAHACGGYSKISYDMSEWVYESSEVCLKKGGQLTPGTPGEVNPKKK